MELCGEPRLLAVQVVVWHGGVVLPLDGPAGFEPDDGARDHARFKVGNDIGYAPKRRQVRGMRKFVAIGADRGRILSGKRERGRVPKAELGFETGFRLLDIAYAEMGGRDMQLDMLDGVRLESFRLAQHAHGLDGRVREIAGGVILEEIVVHLASPWRKLDRLWQFLAALRGDESLCRFE